LTIIVSSDIQARLIFTSNLSANKFYRIRFCGCKVLVNPFTSWEADFMAFNFKSLFKARDSKKNRKSTSPFLELLEERLECATRVWDGSAIPNGTNVPPVFGDPTFSSFLKKKQSTGWRERRS
jgi:hypothetical protein